MRERVLRMWFTGGLGEEEIVRKKWGRMVGTPSQFFQDSPSSFVKWVERVQSKGSEVYMSINYYAGHNILAGLERLMFDFDSKEGADTNIEKVRTEVKKLVDILSSYCEPLIMFTGRRGYHLHVWLPKVLDVVGWSRDFSNDIHRGLVDILLGKHIESMKTLDHSTLRPTVLSRIPYTRRASGAQVTPLDRDLRPIDPESFSLDQYMVHSLPLNLVKEAVERAFFKKTTTRGKAILPLARNGRRIEWIDKVLDKGLPDGRKRFIFYVAARYLVNNLGMDMDEAVELLHTFTAKGGRPPLPRSLIRNLVRSNKRYGRGPPGLALVRSQDPELFRLVANVLEEVD